MKQKSITKIIEILKEIYPEPQTELNHTTPFELLIATILSAQSTDKQVNKVTSGLFQKYNTSEDFAKLKISKLEKEIKSIGLYHNKSKYIIKTSQMIINKFEGRVPENRKDLMKLPGVGRKTANVVLACAFNKPAIAVDTHVFRVANRLGIIKASNVNQAEKQLMKKISKNLWSDLHHWLIFHGRSICKANNPKCNFCALNKYCLYTKNQK